VSLIGLTRAALAEKAALAVGERRAGNTLDARPARGRADHAARAAERAGPAGADAAASSGGPDGTRHSAGSGSGGPDASASAAAREAAETAWRHAAREAPAAAVTEGQQRDDPGGLLGSTGEHQIN
jgi:hypothetical protein